MAPRWMYGCEVKNLDFTTDGRAHRYELTSAGHDLFKVCVSLGEWGHAIRRFLFHVLPRVFTASAITERPRRSICGPRQLNLQTAQANGRRPRRPRTRASSPAETTGRRRSRSIHDRDREVTVEMLAHHFPRAVRASCAMHDQQRPAATAGPHGYFRAVFRGNFASLWAHDHPQLKGSHSRVYEAVYYSRGVEG